MVSQLKPDPAAIAVVVLADLAQIRADSRTHSDSDAKERIAKAVDRITSIFEGKMTAGLQAKINKAMELMQSC